MRGGGDLYNVQGVYGKESDGFPLKSLPKLPEKADQEGGAKTKRSTKSTKTKTTVPKSTKKTDPVSAVASRAEGGIATKLLSLMRGSKTRPMRGGATVGTLDTAVVNNMTNAFVKRNVFDVMVSPQAVNYTSHLDPVTSTTTVMDIPELTKMSIMDGGAKKGAKKQGKKKTVPKK